MVAKPLDIHPAALAELKAAVSWYLEQNESAAINFSAEVDQAVSLISASPQRWPAADHGTRRFVLRRFPYAIFYREQREVIRILAFAHGRRSPGYWKSRR